MKCIVVRLILVLCLLFPTAAFAGTWVVNFVPLSDASATAAQCWGAATATWTPTDGGDASGILNPFTVTMQMDAKNTTMQTQFLNLCKSTWTQQQQGAQGTISAQLSALLTAGTNALNASVQH